MSQHRRILFTTGCLLIIVSALFLFAFLGQPVKAQLFDKYSYLPIVYKQAPPEPPSLYSIDNSDQDNYYSIYWSVTEAEEYILQEAKKGDFSDASVVYRGSWLSWSLPAGQYPGTYYYRVAASNQFGQSAWSNIQWVTVYPLFVGLQVRWDGPGYIRGSDYYDIGWHQTMVCNNLTELDTIQCIGNDWYDPNPLGFYAGTWDNYYSPTTGVWKGSSVSPDPAWKWDYDWKLAYTAQFTNGQTVNIGGQNFTVTGTYNGLTNYGKPITYWQFVNQAKFLFHDSGNVWTQYVHPGEAILRYDAGGSRLLIYSNIKRRFYYQGGQTSDTVQYIQQLTSSTSLPGSPPFVMNELLEESSAGKQPFSLNGKWRQFMMR